MGFFDDIKERIRFAQMDKDVEIAKRNGLYEGTHMENCERCRHFENANSSTGLVCTGRSNMTVPASYTCEHFFR